jgi:predicted porin
MRKLLLAGVAIVGSAGIASAQTTTLPMSPTQGLPTQYNAILAGNNPNNQDGNPSTGGRNAPTPGSVVIHLNGRINFYAAVEGSSADNVNGNKLAPQQFLEYFRLYPGFDGLATNGLRYGGIVEIRQNFAGQTYGLTGATSNGTAFGSSASGNSSAGTLYVRREAVYFGTDQLGIVRLGQDDGVFSQFDGGVTTFQNFNDSGWNGDVENAIPSKAQPNFPFWSGIGAEYGSDKATYFSPSFHGLDAGISYIPNTSSANDGACNVAGSGCAALSSSTTPADGARPTNVYEIMGRYRAAFDGLGVYAIAGYSGSAHVNTPTGVQFNGFSVTDVGLAVTYAGFTVGGNGLFGAYNGEYALQPQGGKGSTSWLAGVQYATGPLVIGASYYNQQSQGSTALVNISQRYDDGFAAGLTYSVAPGMVVYVSYLYGQVHQGDLNILTGTTGTNAYNDVKSQAFALGTRMYW